MWGSLKGQIWLGCRTFEMSNLGPKNGVDLLHGGAEFTKTLTDELFFSAVFAEPERNGTD
jgi:hypothetical protein